LSNRKGTNSLVSAPGAHSLAEILSQPQFWSGCITELERSGTMANLRQDFGSATEWLFIGCGSSYYIGLAAAATCSAITGKRARAIPASELLLFPDLVLAGSQEIAAAVISRSGRTSETLKAAPVSRTRERCAYSGHHQHCWSTSRADRYQHSLAASF